MTDDPVAPVARDTCDLCGGARERTERHRLVWDTGLGSELVLAELCGRCAERPDRLLEAYGGHDRATLKLTRVHALREAQPRPALLGIVLRGVVYVLIAIAAFVVVTSVTSR